MSDVFIYPFVVSKYLEIGKWLRMKTQTASDIMYKLYASHDTGGPARLGANRASRLPAAVLTTGRTPLVYYPPTPLSDGALRR